MGKEISPTLLFHVTMKDAKKFELDGWREVQMTFVHDRENLCIRYTGIGGKPYATQKRNSETKTITKVNPIVKAFRQAFSFFR